VSLVLIENEDIDNIRVLSGKKYSLIYELGNVRTASLLFNYYQNSKTHGNSALQIKYLFLFLYCFYSKSISLQ
jgi:hypothetical protein